MLEIILEWVIFLAALAGFVFGIYLSVKKKKIRYIFLISLPLLIVILVMIFRDQIESYLADYVKRKVVLCELPRNITD